MPYCYDITEKGKNQSRKLGNMIFIDRGKCNKNDYN